jgi:phage terminase large subunit
MFLRLRNGSTWAVIGSDNYDTLVGTPPAGIIFSEWARANPASWAYLAPILVENDGWAVFITTPLGRNHAKSMLDMARNNPAWFAEISTVADTAAISLDAVEEQRTEYHALFGEDAGDALIAQEYHCSFAAAVLGAFYGKELTQAELEGRVCQVDVTPGVPIHTAWDIGIDDPMAIWVFQVEPGRVNVIDYYESSGQGLRHYTDWLNERGYRGGIDWLPHDAKARELGDQETPRTRVQNLIGLGRRPRIVTAHTLMDGINAGRQTLPRAWFDATRCARGLEALREYKAEWDDDSRTFKKTPKHDWASHAADAWRYLSLAWREPMQVEDEEAKRQKMIEELYRRPTLNEMVKQHFEDLGLEPGEDFAEID